MLLKFIFPNFRWKKKTATIPTNTANHNVTTLVMNVVAAASLAERPFDVNISKNEPSVTPRPPGNIETAPTIVEKL
jgi:hypothetical protein